MIKWLRTRRRSSAYAPDGSLDTARRLNALYDEQQLHEDQQLRRFPASMDISTMQEVRQPHPLDVHRRTPEQLNSDGEMSSAPSTEANAIDSWLEFPFDKLILGQILHEGAFTQVLKGEAEGLNKIDEHIVVVKTLKDGASRLHNKLLKAELEMMKDLGSHPNIVPLLGVCTQRHPFCLLLEYLPHGSLLQYMRSSRGVLSHAEFTPEPLDSNQLFHIILQATKGMAYLEGADIVHRDVAARNVFIGDNLVAKIGNFEHCIEGQMSVKALTGTELHYTLNRIRCVREKWLSLETLSSNSWSTASDVWSFGVLLWEIATLGGSPYCGMPAKGMLDILKSGTRLEQPSHCSDQLYYLMTGCWEAMPAWRPQFSQLVDAVQILALQPEEHLNMAAYDNKLYLSFDAEYRESQLL